MNKKKIIGQLRNFYEQENSNTPLQLSLETTMVLQLHYKEGKSFKEISDILGKSISTIYNHHYDGIYQWKKYINQQQNISVQ